MDEPGVQDKLAYLLHIIHAVPAFRKDEDINETGGYTILKSTYIQNRVHEYVMLMGWLTERGILEINGHYIKGKRSMGYRFAPAYRTELTEYRITSWPLIKSILLGKKRSKIEQPVLNPEDLYGVSPVDLQKANMGYSALAKKRLQYLKKWFSNKLNIDTDLAEQYLRSVLNQEQQDKTILQPMHNFNCRKMVLDAVVNHKDMLFYVDDTAGRLHTPLTNLKSELKAFINYDGKPIVAADIKNSQPLLTLVFMDEHLFHKNRMLERIGLYNDRFRIIGGFARNNSPSLCSTLVNFMRIQAQDVDLYKNLVLSGELYEYFGRLLLGNGIAQGLGDIGLRKYAKGQIFRAFFDRNQAINGKDSQALRLFRQHFPTVYEVFRLIKMGKHNTLACSLQNLEAEIVLHKACGELFAINPEVPLFTIHDSIASTIEHYGLVEQVLKKHLSEVLGSDVKIKREPWDESLLIKPASEPTQPTPEIQSLSNIGYGYADDTGITKPYTHSVSVVARKLNIGSRTLFKGLRKLNVLYHNDYRQNIPFDEFVDSGYFIVIKIRMTLLIWQ
ncbi:hypothetical protein [Paraflavitalea speifideaquila]|uniref:hypothetical protein n=1 Tax=Paraflavitalea speifideaquila TaxID=3076558 RepID=UPI0028E7D83F|nr:hypothetical protein [Paraflavitalea speifideiaquila]